MQFDCSVLENLKTEHEFSESCITNLVENNMFNHVSYLISDVYSSDKLRDILPLIKRVITKVRIDQEFLLDYANSSSSIMILNPAFQWAQDLSSVAISVKFAHRLDSPSCIDIFNQSVIITDNNFTVSCMCRRHDGVSWLNLNRIFIF